MLCTILEKAIVLITVVHARNASQCSHYAGLAIELKERIFDVASHCDEHHRHELFRNTQEKQQLALFQRP